MAQQPPMKAIAPPSPSISTVTTALASPQLSTTASKSGRLEVDYLVAGLERDLVDYNDYPFGVSSFLPSLHDAASCQELLANSHNFDSTSICDVFEIRAGLPNLQLLLQDNVFDDWILHTSTATNVTFRAIFLTLDTVNASDSSFGHRLSLQRKHLRQILMKFHVSPQFVPLLLGQPNYWAPGDFAFYDLQHQMANLEFFCQLPRFNIHHRGTAWSVYMRHDLAQDCTTYLIVNGKNYRPCERIKASLADVARLSEHGPKLNPFDLHTSILHEALIEGQSVINRHRRHLYNNLDLMDGYVNKNGPNVRQVGENFRSLEDLTIELHQISQDTDSLIASADMAYDIASRMLSSHERYADAFPGNQAFLVRTSDTITYLRNSIDGVRSRWLVSYKLRKDIAMKLVYNLITQRDMSSTIQIAKDTKADSASMKAIAALTMVFLPGTFMATLFALKFFDEVNWWIYLITTLVLTAIVLLTWCVWAGEWRIRRWIAGIMGSERMKKVSDEEAPNFESWVKLD